MLFYFLLILYFHDEICMLIFQCNIRNLKIVSTPITRHVEKIHSENLHAVMYLGFTVNKCFYLCYIGFPIVK